MILFFLLLHIKLICLHRFTSCAQVYRHFQSKLVLTNGKIMGASCYSKDWLALLTNLL